VAPAATTLDDAGEIVGAQVAPACVTVKVWPATVIVPVRFVDPVLAAALNETEPGPEPGVPPVTVIQGALLVAFQLQPAAAVTATLPVPPAAAMLVDVGEIDGAQVVPAWVTVKVLPAIVNVPVRLALPVFTATL
jgi:hypothetical protein